MWYEPRPLAPRIADKEGPRLKGEHIMGETFRATERGSVSPVATGTYDGYVALLRADTGGVVDGAQRADRRVVAPSAFGGLAAAGVG